MFADDWKSASESFAKINSYHELKLLCDRVEKEKVSVTFAKVISYILPGAGQFYTGHYLSGTMSLGYSVLFGYLTINAFIEDRVFDGAAIGALLWLRFYRGNVQNAEEFAEEKNIVAANKALRYLQNNYQGNKP
jgi:TM2 domain-containing membrane protein YozV